MKEIQLTRGMSALVDDADFDWLSAFSWCANKTNKHVWYAITTIKSKQVYMHRLILGLTERYQRTDHKNGNGLDNQRVNLRLSDASSNNCNRGKNSNNTSGYKGVIWCKITKSWRAQIGLNNKCIIVGNFKTPEFAAHAYDLAARSLHGEFARPNT